MNLRDRPQDRQARQLAEGGIGTPVSLVEAGAPSDVVTALDFTAQIPALVELISANPAVYEDLLYAVNRHAPDLEWAVGSGRLVPDPDGGPGQVVQTYSVSKLLELNMTAVVQISAELLAPFVGVPALKDLYDRAPAVAVQALTVAVSERGVTYARSGAGISEAVFIMRSHLALDAPRNQPLRRPAGAGSASIAP